MRKHMTQRGGCKGDVEWHLLKILRVSMISLNAKKFSMRQLKHTLRPRAAGPALRSAGGAGAGGPTCCWKGSGFREAGLESKDSGSGIAAHRSLKHC